MNDMMKESRNHKLVIFLVGVTLLFHGSLLASLKFERFSNEEGFNQNTIVDIAQDRFGFLWFATPNGLIKYDGYNFYDHNYDPVKSNTISSNRLECLHTDSKGNIWIGSWKGVDVYLSELEKFVSVPFDAGFVVSEIIAGENGSIWVAGHNALYRIIPDYNDSGISFELSDNMTRTETGLSRLSDLCFIDDKSFLFSETRGLSRCDFKLEDSSVTPVINSVHQYDELGEEQVLVIKKIESIFWIGSHRGLYKAVLDGDKLRIIERFSLQTRDKRLLSDITVLSIFEDREGKIWIGTGNEGIFKYDPYKNTFENYGFDPKNENGISSSRINTIVQDNFGVIWVGTAQGGVNKLDMNQKQFLNYTHNPYDESSLAGNLIMDILEDDKDRLWISSYDGEVCRSKEPISDKNIGNLRFEYLKSRIPGPTNSFFSVIYQDNKGYIWLGSETSVVVYNPYTDQFKIVSLEYEGKGQEIPRWRFIGQLDESTMLLGGEKILLLHNPWKEINATKTPAIKAVQVLSELRTLNAFIKDKERDDYWFGTQYGLIRCARNGDEFSIKEEYASYSGHEYKLLQNNVFSLHQDPEGSLWIGTFGGGLNKLSFDASGKPVQMENFRKNTLLPDDAVYGILDQGEDYLWISTDMGLCRFQRKEKQVTTFNMQDGLAHNNFRQSAFCKGRSGYYYFGGLNGLTIFKPEHIKLNDELPNTLITGISINNKRVDVGKEVNGKVLLKKSANETDHIILNHHAKTVTFHLAVLHNTSPAKNKLAYQLEGFNNEWIELAEGKASITYTSLPAGEYTLRVKGANGDGIWNHAPTDMELSVLPPWFRTWWSYTMGSLLLIAIAVGVFIYFVRLEKLKQRLKYEQIDKKRIDSINEGKLRFFTNISHEFRTPLTLIAGPLEKVMERNNDEKSSKYLTTIQNNTKRLLSLVDQLITFRKAEQGHLNLNLTADTLGNFIYPTTEAFEDFAIQKNVNFFYKINSPNEEVVIDVEKTERIIFNLLSNSFRHTPANGNISIETDLVLQDEKRFINIRIIDTGSGIPADKMEKIFDRFYQLEGRNENVGGTGIGLAFCKTLIDLMGGTITVESEPGIRTCFSIFMPSMEAEREQSKGTLRPGQSFIKDWVPAVGADTDEGGGKVDKTSGKHSLLIVEDESDVRDFLHAELKGDYTVTMAENGQEGLSKLKQGEPDLVVSDVMMPEMTGFELCERIKSDPDTCHIPVILLTALDDKENTLKGLEFGADDYIAKPFSPRHLLIRIEKLIEKNQRLKEYFSKNSSIPDKSIEISTRDKEFLKQVIEAIERNLSNSNFGVEELAHEIRLSPSQFYRRLKQLTGQIPNVYLRNFRLQRAAEMLKSNEGFSVAEVMYQIGIESSSYFSTSFKKLFGVSPSEFLKKNH